MDSITSSSSDSIFTSIIGGSKLENVNEFAKHAQLPPINAKTITYEVPIQIESIGMPVYLAGIIQLLSVVILLSKKKTYQASVSFFTIGIFMFTVHCVYAGKADKLGQFNPLCRNFSYLLILFPLINIMLVLSSDYAKIWKNIIYNPGQLQIKLPHFQMNEQSTNDDDDNNDDNDDNDDNKNN